MIVERVRIHYHILIRRGRAVFSPAVFRPNLHQPFERRPIFFIRLDIMRDRKSKNINETPLPIRRGKAKRRNRQAEFPRRLGKHAIRFENRLARPGNDRRKPDMPGPGRRINFRPRSNREIRQAGNAELRFMNFIPLLGG